jgi:glycosyltransferase involved in cell wall biosynthesis
MSAFAARSGIVSIGIPTRNRSAFAVRAIRSALAQTYADVEVVVSDNASSDDTMERIQEINDPRLVTIRQAANVGMAGNFNACLRNATGEFFLMLSDDDVLEPTAIEELKRPFDRPPEGCGSVGLSWCPCVILNGNGDAMWTTQAGPAVESPVAMITAVFNGNRGPRLCGVICRTADVLSVGGYNEERHGVLCDYGNWARVALRYDSVACILKPLSRYTIHGSSLTSESTCDHWRILAENICEDMVNELRASGKTGGIESLVAANRNAIANLVVTVLMPAVGKPGWIRHVIREVFAMRSYMFTPFVARRLLRDGWKALRLKRNQS